MAPDIREEVRRLLVLGALTLPFSLFIAINVNLQAGLIFASLTIGGMFLILFRDQLIKPGVTVRIEGIESTQKSIPDVIAAIVVVGAFIAFSTLSEGFTIFVPVIPQSQFAGTLLAAAGQGLVIVILAPLSEELFFRSALKSVVLEGALGLSQGVANIVQAIAFSGFHIVAYAGVLSGAAIIGQSGAFLTATIMGFSFAVLTDSRKNLLPAIVAHSLFNLFVFTTLAVVVG